MYKRQPLASSFSSSKNIETVVDVLRRGQERLLSVPNNRYPYLIAGERFDPIESVLDVLEGREFYRPSTGHVPAKPGDRTFQADLENLVGAQVFGFLFTALCVAYDADAPVRLVLTRGRLLPYLYEHSSSLEDAFTGTLRGESFPLFPSMELLSRATVADLLAQLESVPVPDDALEIRKAQAKWDSLRGSGPLFVSSQFAEAFGQPVSSALRDLKNQLKESLGNPNFAIVQEFG